MKKIFMVFAICILTSYANSQPCKLVKIGMTKAEVLKLVGHPNEINPLGMEKASKDSLVIWQYGDVSKDGNQRIAFKGDKVESEVIADGKKYDELMMAFQKGDFPAKELDERIKKLNDDNCK